MVCVTMSYPNLSKIKIWFVVLDSHGFVVEFWTCFFQCTLSESKYLLVRISVSVQKLHRLVYLYFFYFLRVFSHMLSCSSQHIRATLWHVGHKRREWATWPLVIGWPVSWAPVPIWGSAGTSSKTLQRRAMIYSNDIFLVFGCLLIMH